MVIRQQHNGTSETGNQNTASRAEADAYLEKIAALTDIGVASFPPFADLSASLPSASSPTGAPGMIRGQLLEIGRQRVLVDDLANLMLSRTGEAALLLNQDGAVDRANSVAKRVLARRDGLLLAELRTVTATDQTANTRLRRAIRAAASLEKGDDLSVADIVPLPRAGMRDPYLVSVVSLRRQNPHQVGPHAIPIALLFRDPDAVFQDFETALRQVHGLTPMEAKVASGTLEGLSLPELAQRNGVSTNTLRTQIKSVFAKMGVHKRSQFVKACYLAARNARQEEPPPVT